LKKIIFCYLVAAAAVAAALSLSIILTDLKKSNKTDIYKDIDWSTDKMTTTGGGVGVGASRFMAYSPSPSAPHSPHISGLRSSAASSALVVEQEKYIYIYIAGIYLSRFTLTVCFTNLERSRSLISVAEI
jgi:hypothetical protein